MKILLKSKEPGWSEPTRKGKPGLCWTRHSDQKGSLTQEIATNTGVTLGSLILGSGYSYLLLFNGNKASKSLFLLPVLSEFALCSAANRTGMPHHLVGMPCSRWAVKFFQNYFRRGSFASETGRVVTPSLKDARQESRPRGEHMLERAFSEPSCWITAHALEVGLQSLCPRGVWAN